VCVCGAVEHTMADRETVRIFVCFYNALLVSSPSSGRQP
jgi:hypothetical protein